MYYHREKLCAQLIFKIPLLDLFYHYMHICCSYPFIALLILVVLP